MNLSFTALVLWAAGFLLNAALLFVLILKRRYRIVPWFTVWMATELLSSTAVFLGYRLGSKHLYTVLYWSSDFLDVLLQAAVVLEIARYILRRSGRWVEGARLRLALMGLTAPLVAFVMAWFMKPATETRLQSLDARSSLFTTILVFLLFTAVVIVSQQLGLGLRSFVVRECYGLMVWSMVAFVTDTLHAYWRTMGHFIALENMRIGAFQMCLIYWAVAFWRPEEELAPIPPEIINRLDSLAARLDYAQSSRVSQTGGALRK